MLRRKLLSYSLTYNTKRLSSMNSRKSTLSLARFSRTATLKLNLILIGSRKYSRIGSSANLSTITLLKFKNITVVNHTSLRMIEYSNFFNK